MDFINLNNLVDFICDVKFSKKYSLLNFITRFYVELGEFFNLCIFMYIYGLKMI